MAVFVLPAIHNHCSGCGAAALHLTVATVIETPEGQRTVALPETRLGREFTCAACGRTTGFNLDMRTLRGP